ncbi:MAG TPA: hypothetical protein VGB55_12205 [Tepidisphaeraceae bacterium]|jgi:uncharacterized membrane protein
MLDFYKRTWWLWLLFIVIFALLGVYVTRLFIVFIPGLMAYSVYFGAVRISEENERQTRAQTLSAAPKPNESRI